MNSRILQVFYGNDCLPYKDKDRQVHFPIVGSGLMGSSNVNTIRFYVDKIGGVNNVAWIVVAKLPNGKQVYQVLSNIALDTETNEYYLEFDVGYMYTNLKGKVFFSLNGYRGNVSISTDTETNVQTIVVAPGSQQIMTTGTIDLTFNYAVVRQQGVEFGLDQYTNIMNALANKSGIVTTIQVVSTETPNTLDISGYSVGQIIYNNYDKYFYQVITQSDEKVLVKYDNFGALSKNSFMLKIVGDLITFEEIWSITNGKMFVIDNGLNNDIICRVHKDIMPINTTLPQTYTISGFGLSNDANGEFEKWKSRTYSGSASIGTYLAGLTQKEHFVKRLDGSRFLYGTSRSGSQVTIDYTDGYSDQLEEGTIAQRAANGGIIVADEPYNEHYAASKYYVDKKVADFGKLSIQVVNITTYPTLDSFLASTGQEGYEYYYPINTAEAPTFTSGYYRYVWENNAWLSLGTTQIDLSGYVPYTGATQNVDLGNKTLKSIVLFAKASFQFGDSDNNKQVFFTTPTNYNDDTNWSARLTKRNGSTTPIADLKFPIETGMLATQEHVSSYYVPYTGATNDVDLGYHVFKALVLKSTTNVLLREGDEQATITSYNITSSNQESLRITRNHIGETVATIRLPIRTGFVAMQEDLDTTNLELNKLKSMFYETVVDIKTYTASYSYDFALPNSISNQPVIFSAGADVDYIEGNSYVVNQLNEFYNFPSNSDYQTSNTTLTISNNIASIVGTNGGSNSIYRFGKNKVVGHKYLVMYTAKASANISAGYGVGGVYLTSAFSVTTDWQTFFGIATAIDTVNTEYVYTYTNTETLEVKEFYIVDLTQMFGSNDLIPQDLLDNPSHFFNYYNGSLAYNEGTLVNSQPTSVTTKDSDNNVLGTYPITTNVLRSAGSVKDNTQIKKIGYVDLGSLEWSYSGGSDNYFYVNISGVLSIKKSGLNSVACNLLCAKYENMAYEDVANNSSIDKAITLDGNSATILAVRDSSFGTDAAAFKTAMSGVILNYELAEAQGQNPSSVVPTDMVIQQGGTCEITYASGNNAPSDITLKLATSKIVEE